MNKYSLLIRGVGGWVGRRWISPWERPVLQGKNLWDIAESVGGGERMPEMDKGCSLLCSSEKAGFFFFLKGGSR